MVKATILFTLLFLLAAAPVFADDVTFTVTVNTSSIDGASGSLDFQFNPGPTATQLADLQILDFTTDGTLESSTPTGDVTGALPGTLTFDNATGFNDYFTDFTFGTTLSFTVSLFGPALSSPDGISTSGSTFAFSMFSDPYGYDPVLTTDSIEGTALTDDINLNGSTTLTNSSGQLSVASTIATPEPGTLFLLVLGLLGLLAVAAGKGTFALS